jgi:hypothetical protein
MAKKANRKCVAGLCQTTMTSNKLLHERKFMDPGDIVLDACRQKSSACFWAPFHHFPSHPRHHHPLITPEGTTMASFELVETDHDQHHNLLPEEPSLQRRQRYPSNEAQELGVYLFSKTLPSQ